MLFHFTPHIHTLGELLKEEGSWTKDLAVSCSSNFKEIFSDKLCRNVQQFKKITTCAAHMH